MNYFIVSLINTGTPDLFAPMVTFGYPIKSDCLHTISVYAVFGNLMKREVATNPKSQIRNLKSFSPGIYFVEVVSGKEVYRSKFVKE